MIIMRPGTGIPEIRPRPMNWRFGVIEHLQIAVREHPGDAPAGDEKHQRRDDRLDLKSRHQPAVEPAESAGDQNRNDERQRDRDAG